MAPQQGKKIRTGVVGAGYLGRFHAQKYAAIEGCEFVGVADIDAGRAKAIAVETGSAAFGDYKELFGKVDAVSIVTPTETHFRIGMDFLGAGIHVLMEKPITVTLSEADTLIKEAASRGLKLQVGHLERFNPAIVEMMKRLRAPLFIETQRLSPFVDRALDVDVVLDLMIHDLDIALVAANSPIKRVDAAGFPVVSAKADFANARIEFENGCVASLTASRVAKDRVRELKVFQPGARMKVDYAGQKFSMTRFEMDSLGKPNFIEEAVELEKGDTIKAEITAFLDCIINGGNPPVGGVDGRKALEAAALVQKAIEASRARS